MQQNQILSFYLFNNKLSFIESQSQNNFHSGALQEYIGILFIRK